MTIKYMVGNSWAYIEGTSVRYTRINLGAMQESVKKHETDELIQLKTMYDYIHDEAEQLLDRNTRENEIMTIDNPLKVSNVCAIQVYDKDRDREVTLFTSDTTFLLSDTGKTIERLL